ncbi:GNAT family N-acetyltransferase [Nocardioides dilutus]
MSSPAPTLPQGYAARPIEMADAQTVTALVAAEELHDIGEVLIEEADYVAEWQRPSFDLETQSIGVWRGEQLVGFAMVDHDRGDAAVHPDHRRQGIGTALAGWMQDCARGQGMRVVGAPVPQGKAADQLLEKLGYRVRWTSWVLELLDGATIAERDLPSGYAVREATPDDYEAVWTVTEDAFLEWSERKRQSFEDWQAAVPGRPGFQPWNIRVATDPAGAVVATSNIHVSGEPGRLGAYIDRLATHREHRHRGLAQALLVDSFRVGREHGAVRSELSTDSRTGALALYEKVGMSVTSVWVNRAKDL